MVVMWRALFEVVPRQLRNGSLMWMSTEMGNSKPQKLSIFGSGGLGADIRCSCTQAELQLRMEQL